MRRGMIGIALGAPALIAAAALGAWGLPSGGSPEVVAATGAAAERDALQTVTLRVDNMYCASCSYIVREALTAVPGVVEATVSGWGQTATVTFDPSQAEISDLTAATGAHGYPAQLLSG